MANRNFQNELGQSLVEYILLLVVVASLSLVVFKNPKFKSFFGEDSDFFTIIRSRMEYSYRHGSEGSTDESNYTNQHDTYKKSNAAISRFFSPEASYP